jgi:beta-carotene 3-hydroxylase
MRSIAINILITISTFCLMEIFAWLSHKYIMHGLLWRLHKDHHRKESKGFFEHNDFFFLIFAIPGILFLYMGMQGGNDHWFFAGTGITAYGLVYFLVHDVFIHQRIKFFRKTDSKYLRAIRRAHKMHHRHLDRKEGECFGMLWVPVKYFKQEMNQ